MLIPSSLLSAFITPLPLLLFQDLKNNKVLRPLHSCAYEIIQLVLSLVRTVSLCCVHDLSKRSRQWRWTSTLAFLYNKSARSGLTTWKADRKSSTWNIIVHLNPSPPTWESWHQSSRVMTQIKRIHSASQTSAAQCTHSCIWLCTELHISWCAWSPYFKFLYMHSCSVWCRE